MLPEKRIISETIQELWSGVIGIGESSFISITRVGEVHPTVVPAAAVIKVAERITGKKLSIHIFKQRRGQPDLV